MRRLALGGAVLDAALRFAAGICATAGYGVLLAADRLRRTPHHGVPAGLPQRAAADRRVGDMGDTAHVAAVTARAFAVALVGGGRANRGELIGVSRIAATGTSARHGASALVVALVVTARTSDSAEQRLQDQQEKNSQGQECAGYHLHWQPPFSARARDARPKTRGEIALVLDKLQYRNAPKSGERPSRASDAPHSRRRGSHNALRVAMCSSDPLPGVDGRQDAERGHQDGGVRRLPAGEPVSLTHLHTFGDLERPGGLLARAEVARRAGQGRHPRARGRRRSARAAAARETGGGPGS